MDFLNKIKNFFSKKPKNSFHDIVRREKQQKYLLHTNEETYISSRKKKKFSLFSTSTTSHNSPKKYKFFEKYFKTKDGERDLRHIMGAIGLLLIFLVGYIIVVSPYFKISPNQILIEPLTDGVDINIVHRSVESIHGKSLFSLDEALLAKNIKENLNNAEFIRIDKLYPNGVKILIKSLPIQFDTTIFGINNKRWGISSNGVLVPMADINSEAELKHLQIISTEIQSELFLNYKKILTDKEMFVIGKIFEIFSAEWPGLTIARANYFATENELHLILESNTKIIFSLHEELQTLKKEISNSLINQFITLKTYLTHNYEKLVEGSIFYVDARISGKIFACANATQCQQNLINIYGNAYE